MATSTMTNNLSKLHDAFTVSASSTITRDITASNEDMYHVIAFRPGSGIIAAWLVNAGGAMSFVNNNSSLSITVSSGTLTVTNAVNASVRVKVMRIA